MTAHFFPNLSPESMQLEREFRAPIEAEGVELEVFDGLGAILPRKFAIDVSPERNGESPADEFLERFARMGYATRQRGHALFAREAI